MSWKRWWPNSLVKVVLVFIYWLESANLFFSSIVDYFWKEKSSLFELFKSFKGRSAIFKRFLKTCSCWGSHHHLRLWVIAVSLLIFLVQRWELLWYIKLLIVKRLNCVEFAKLLRIFCFNVYRLTSLLESLRGCLSEIWIVLIWLNFEISS